MSNSESLAKQIAHLLKAETPSADLTAILASLEIINARLDKLEAGSVRPQPAVLDTRSNHPSLDKYTIAEAIADAVIDGKPIEKACTFEPNNSPCDHCSMCSSRGF